MRRLHHDLVTFGVALLGRLAVVLWAASRIPPAADGTYYQTLATRLAEGHGYTWLWPDGAVTYAAHYPVGYPALLALVYAAVGVRPVAAMVLNALVGALAAVAVRRAVLPFGEGQRGAPVALLAGLFVALHPALVPYTPALMTEGVTAALLAIAAACAARGRFTVGALVLGLATLVRPQSLLLAPLYGALVGVGSLRFARLRGALVALAIAVVCCLPWTARNCVRMHKCALVSVNAGWNLLIGEQTDSGAWQEIAVPAGCREVWDEAAKDDCFAQAARAEILAHPLAWLARAPAKVSVTFDYFGAAPWYLHVANAQAFTEKDKLALAVVETVATRVLLLFALVAAARREGPRVRARRVVAVIGALAALTPHGAIGYLALAVALLLASPPRFAWRREDFLLPWTAGTLLVTAATHAVFFGAGRYGVVVLPLVAAVAALSFARTARPELSSVSRSIS